MNLSTVYLQMPQSFKKAPPPQKKGKGETPWEMTKIIVLLSNERLRDCKNILMPSDIGERTTNKESAKVAANIGVGCSVGKRD